ncbi:MAG TPA: hypothetical protein VG734_10715 [Lacunisphaera sp.]|nr:hypothetical protein [Lacunisphaera sp.]
MNQLEGLLLLLFFPLGILLSGYWLAGALGEATPSERLAVGLLAGLSLTLFLVSVVNFFVPLSLPWAALGLLPMVVTLAGGRSRRSLWSDLNVFARDRETRLAGLLLALFFALLLWPMIAHGHIVFYDGTSNHDSFFWVASAEYLKRHSYMDPVAISATQPLFNAASALIGWSPYWGRIGAEGLLALSSALVGASPLKIYLYGTAVLYLPWTAAVFLAAKTFFNRRLSPAALVGLAVLQPLFIFYIANANLPNLVGTITGATTILALEHALRTGPQTRPAFTAWATLAALGLHGLLCSYPEMGPFVLLSCGLLWLRPWFTQGPRQFGRTGLLTAGALLLGFALNLATSVRAVFGFITSFKSARADDTWANLFLPLDRAEFLPGLISLSIYCAKELGGWLGWPLSTLIVVVFALTVRSSRDRYGLCAALAGSLALLGYTVATDFAYGWQKTVQFSGIFIATVFPVAAFDLLWGLRTDSPWRRHAATAALGALAAFMAGATLMNCRDIYKWSERKVISDDWFALRESSRTTLRQAPVLIEAGSFRMAFFYSMWAAYFLPESRIYFGARGEENGGYLRDYVLKESKAVIPSPAAVLVGRQWADTLDANSPRLLNGREFVLVERSNRVFQVGGNFPVNGPPERISGAFNLEILPHSPSDLVIELEPPPHQGVATAEWHLQRTAPDTAEFASSVPCAAPWVFRIPLVAGRRNAVALNLVGLPHPADLAFGVRALWVENRP